VVVVCDFWLQIFYFFRNSAVYQSMVFVFSKLLFRTIPVEIPDISSNLCLEKSIVPDIDILQICVYFERITGVSQTLVDLRRNVKSRTKKLPRNIADLFFS
jgi:hypothetical protein